MDVLAASILALALDADTIFARCRTATGAAAYPRYARYATVVAFDENGKHVRDTYDTNEDLSHGNVYAPAISREERANPHVPHGSNIAILGFNLNPEVQRSPIGPVAFAIDQNYGIAPAPQHFSVVQTRSLAAGGDPALTKIGETRTASRTYDVRLVETTNGAVGPQYHLTLTPLRDPQRNRLRELWVDGTTWLPQEATVSGIAGQGPFDRTPFHIEFQRIGDSLFLRREHALAAMTFNRRTVADVTVEFTELQTATKPPLYSIGFSAPPAFTDP